MLRSLVMHCAHLPACRPTKARLVLALAAALAVGGLSLDAASFRISPLARDGSVLVSFSFDDGYTQQVHDAIWSGLRTTFTYTVDLRLEVPAWIDRTIDSTVVSNVVEYDNLTRRHTLIRIIDGREDSRLVTDDEAEVRAWMTSFERLALFRTSLLEPNREYYVRVQATARPRSGGSLWPWESGLSGQAKFLFLP
ncbi:MAG: DUF4390 domain-containing protein [Acidobacteria bacterium]|nr:DUF4390 domain-containing protein [Acidobacteriota bacterium]